MNAAQKAWATRRAKAGNAAAPGPIGDFGGRIAGAAKHRVTNTAATPAAAKRPRRAPKPPRYVAYMSRTDGKLWIERKGDRLHRKLVEFESRAALAEFRQLPDYFERLAALWETAREAANVTDGKVRGGANKPRNGIDYRAGRDVSPAQFLEVFAPYGVQFGNWQTDRAGCLNQAYDALLDLAKFLRLEPAGVGLGGRLGIAFGARGKGKAAAHYEQAHRVINLTKKNGAGCLAHEWFHAYDHDQSIVAGRAALSASDGLWAVFKKLPIGLKTRSHNADKTRSKKYYSLPHEILARAFEAWVRHHVDNDYLANIVKFDAFACGQERYPYPLPAELPAVDAAFRELFGLPPADVAAAG